MEKIILMCLLISSVTSLIISWIAVKKSMNEIKGITAQTVKEWLFENEKSRSKS